MEDFKKFINKIGSALAVVFGIMLFNAFKLELIAAIKFCLLYTAAVCVIVLISYLIYKMILKSKKRK